MCYSQASLPKVYIVVVIVVIQMAAAQIDFRQQIRPSHEDVSYIL